MGAKVIAIDGPAYVGKSQIAQGIAKKLGYEFINTGHMYRAIAKVALDQMIPFENETALINLPIRIYFLGGRTFVSLSEDQKAFDWTYELDKVEIVESAGKIAKLAGVRNLLTQMQRQYAQKQWIVMEGRDIGTVVFPDAEWKFFVTASEEVRAKRVLKMLSEEERKTINFAKALEKIQQIDFADKNRKIAPLLKASDAIEYDNGAYTVEEDVNHLYGLIKAGKKAVRV